MPTSDQDAELIVAGGMLQACGGLDERLKLEAAIARLRELLSPAALWRLDPASPSLLEASMHLRFGQLPRWHAPDPDALDAVGRIVLAAWREALPTADWSQGDPVLRLEVDTVEAVRRLAELRTVGRHLIAPSVLGRHAGRFSWRWPIRIGIAEGPHRDRWRRALERSPYGSLYDLQAVEADPAQPLDIVFVDADAATAAPAATCLVVLGDATSAAERTLQGLAEGPQAAIVIGAASSDLGWFDDAVREMSHDQPLDVALRIASPDAVIAADPSLLPLTAARQWSLELVRQLHGQAADDPVVRGESTIERLHAIAVHDAFDSERGGAERQAGAVRELDRQGYDTVLHVHRPMSGARPPEPDPAPAVVPAPMPEGDAAPARRLIADAWANGKLRSKALLPERVHELRVRIGFPAAGETSAQEAFPENELPAGASVELMVDATSAALGLHERRPIVLSTADRSVPSTTAVFKFRTPGAGAVADIKILVTYQERPLQEAHYVATVRSRPISGDLARITTVALSSSPEPGNDATPAQLSLEVNGANLERSGSRDAINLPQIQDLLDNIEQRASRVLADEDAPASLDDGDATELLVQLARLGAKLRAYLDPLRIDDAGTISLLVDATTAILPLELVYEAPAPNTGAKLCEHRTGGRMAGKAEACADAGKDVVCPYAFWGQQRVIARTLRLRRAPARRAAPEPLGLSPVLYAAVAHADVGAPANRRPSDLLEKELTSIVGASRLKRVNDWNDWKTQVRQQHPQLLVLLGHTESLNGETGLEIGRNSWLYDPDVDAAYLRDAGAPPPLVVLLACSTGVPRNVFGGLPAAFTGNGAAAVVATLAKLTGPHGARAAASVVQAVFDGAAGATRLGTAMTAARRRLIDDGLLVGLLLVSHGEIDLPLGH